MSSFSLATCFHEAGLRVFATARDRAVLKDLEAKGMETLSLTVDNEQSVQECHSKIQELTGESGLDYLVNNAGRNYVVPALDISMDEVRAVFETNVFAIMRLVQAFSNDLVKARGTIIMIGSVAAVIPYVFGSVYNASKGAVHAYSNALRAEMAPLGVKVITVVTGGVKSNIARTKRELPSTSLYSAANEGYQRRQLHSQEVGVDTDKYARTVVQQVLPGSGPWPWRWLLRDARRSWIWAGQESSLLWLVFGGWTWSSMFDGLVSRMFQLNLVTPPTSK
ncbi:MAG: hypothetical protein Q9160_006118 [Pyrenula sp. 1 TL-2023]